MMQLEDYFDFLAENDIRVKGHRIGIESILYEYIHREQGPEAIADRFPSLKLEQIYATILYYLVNKAEIKAYMAAWIEHEDRMVAEQSENPSSDVLRLRQIKLERQQTQPV
jgi:uncharacterized protein (DUF433 family)